MASLNAVARFRFWLAAFLFGLISFPVEAQDHPTVAALYMQDFYGAGEMLQAEAGSYLSAPFMLGELYARGDGVPQDEYEAIYWMREAERKGMTHPLLSGLENRHPEVPEGEVALFELYQATAKKTGSTPQDKFRLGAVLEAGRGTPVDRTEALGWYLQAAAAGHPFAMIAVGRHYFEVERNLEKAARWMSEAAASGNPIAQHHSADFLLIRNEPGDSEKALGLYLAAANSNYGKAQAMAGGILATGRGAAKDTVEGAKWLALAAPKVSRNLNARLRPAIRSVWESLTETERETVRERVRAFLVAIDERSEQKE